MTEAIEPMNTRDADTPGHANARRLAAMLAERFPSDRIDLHLTTLTRDATASDKLWGGGATVDFQHAGRNFEFEFRRDGSSIGVSIDPHYPFTLPDRLASTVEEAVAMAMGMLNEERERGPTA